MTWTLLALLLAARDPPTVEVQRPGDAAVWALDWDAPPACPSREALFERIRGYLPALELPPAAVPRARLRVEARVAAGTDEWIVRLRLQGEMGETVRSFSAASCEELTDAVALVAAVALDPVLVSGELAEARRVLASEPGPEPETEVEPEPELEITAVPAVISVDDEARMGEGEPALGRDVRVGLRLAAGGGFGPTNTSYGALAAGVAVFADRWRWSLDGGGWLPRTVRDGAAAGRFWGWWIGTRGCVVPKRGAIEVPLCGGLELGQVLGVGLPPAIDPQRSSFPWLAFSLGAGLNWVITERVALVGDVAALLPIVTREFVVGEQVLQRGVPVGVRATLGIELRI